MSEPVKEYNPQEQITVTLGREQWDTVLDWLKSGADYHHAKARETLDCWQDKKMAREIAAQHERAMQRAESLRQIIEGTLYPAPVAGEETQA